MLVSMENTQCIWEKTEMRVRQSFANEKTKGGREREKVGIS
jgi:hypothetical protein